jgi:3'-5' exoribonuclease
MDKIWAKDLVVGNMVRIDLMVASTRTGETKGGKPAIWMDLQDRTGTVGGVRWGYYPAVDGTLEQGKVYWFSGVVSDYKGKPQITIEGFAPITSVPDMTWYEKITQFSIPEMWDKIVGFIESMESDIVRDVARDIMLNQGYEEAFRYGPAATGMHHAFKGGLLEHTSQMCETVEQLFTLPFYANNLSKDLCMFGVLFHDFGKIFEYKQDAGFAKTLQGFLVPHIPMTGAIIFETCNKFGVPEIVRDHLMHVVLAHHGQVAWGSPVDMACPEAGFIHYVDHLHGDVFGWLQRMEGSKEEVLNEKGKRTLVNIRFDDILKKCESSMITESSSPLSSS